MYSLTQGAKLIELARHSIETFIDKKPLSLEPYREFDSIQGVFVTIKKDGTLRGEMGFVDAEEPLYKAVVKVARDAAFRDKRFPPIKKEELFDIEIEMTIIMTKPALMRVLRWEDYIKQIHFGYDGLMIKAGVFSSIMLPQTAGPDWDTERMLRQLCISAGLTMDSWKDLSHQVFKFSVQVFAERRGKVIEII